MEPVCCRDDSSEQEMVYSAADTFLTCVKFGAHSRRVLNKILSEARVRDTYAILEKIYRSLAYALLLLSCRRRDSPSRCMPQT